MRHYKVGRNQGADRHMQVSRANRKQSTPGKRRGGGPFMTACCKNPTNFKKIPPVCFIFVALPPEASHNCPTLSAMALIDSDNT
jgi:hypothetical protein